MLLASVRSCSSRARSICTSMCDQHDAAGIRAILQLPCQKHLHLDVRSTRCCWHPCDLAAPVPEAFAPRCAINTMLLASVRSCSSRARSICTSMCDQHDVAGIRAILQLLCQKYLHLDVRSTRCCWHPCGLAAPVPKALAPVARIHRLPNQDLRAAALAIVLAPVPTPAPPFVRG